MDDALKMLEDWNRKYYRFRIECGGSIQPGDGVFVELMGGGRKVYVSEDELTRWGEGDEEDYFPTIGDLIKEAIRLWHADSTPKKYDLFWVHPENMNFCPVDGVKFEKWGISTMRAQLVARNEAEAINMIWEGYPKGTDLPGRITAYEKGPA